MTERHGRRRDSARSRACAAAAWRRIAMLLALAVSGAACANAALPPRSAWRASSSSVEAPAIASHFAIDGDESTRWGGAFSAGHWLQVDLGSDADVGGVRIHWDSAFAAAYTIQASRDATKWRTVYETADSTGDIDYVFFAATRARYLRLVSVPRTADWGVSLFEFEPLAAADVPRVEGLAGAGSAWSLAAAQPLSRASAGAAYELSLRFARPLSTAGLEVDWGAARRSARLELRDSAGAWSLLAEDPQPLGASSYLAGWRFRLATALAR